MISLYCGKSIDNFFKLLFKFVTDVDQNGQVRYDAIVKQGSNRSKLVQSSIDDLKEKQADKVALALPDEKEEQETADRTKLALEAIIEGKIMKSKPSTIVNAKEPEEPTYIRYTADPNAPGFKILILIYQCLIPIITVINNILPIAIILPQSKESSRWLKLRSIQWSRRSISTKKSLGDIFMHILSKSKENDILVFLN